MKPGHDVLLTFTFIRLPDNAYEASLAMESQNWPEKSLALGVWNLIMLPWCLVLAHIVEHE